MWKRSERTQKVDCQQVEAWLTAYLKEGLSTKRHQVVEDHLAACDACARSVQQAQILESELRLQAAHHNPTLSAEASARIHERVYRRMRRGLIMQRTVKLAGVAVAVVAIALLAVGAMALWQGRPSETADEQDVTPVFTQGVPTSVPATDTSVPPTPVPTSVPATDTSVPPTPVPPTRTPAPTATAEALPFPVEGSFAKASLTWEFRPDGTYITEGHTQLLNSQFSGTYTVTGDQIVIQDDYVPCKDVVGTYAWTYDGEVLTLTKVDDACRDRAGMAWGKWRKKP